jgi:hypothetical protein
MTWDEVLSYEKDVRSIARRWANKKDPDLYEDAVHHTYIVLFEKLDLAKAEGPEKEYVKGAIWNIVRKFFNSPWGGGWDHISLETLHENGFQVDEDGTPRWSSADGEYRGDYKPDDKS